MANTGKHFQYERPLLEYLHAIQLRVYYVSVPYVTSYCIYSNATGISL
jgi:hypothetical protein